VTYVVKSCALCGSHEIALRWATDRQVTTTCLACRRIVQIEFDPPDEPGIRGRIELVIEPVAIDDVDDGEDDR
jgi:hypothetical protein